jgi:hypothetical protein
LEKELPVYLLRRKNRTMKPAPKPMPARCNPPQALGDHRRLLSLIADLTREVDRLTEDNRQLHAAVGVYREIVRRTLAHPAENAESLPPKNPSA